MAVPQNPARAARRARELRDKLGSEQPVCFHCGEAEIAVLRPVSRKLLEDHHLLGRNHDPKLTVLLCPTCHFLQHEKLLDASVDLRAEADPVRRVIVMLRAEAVHLEALAGTKRNQAAILELSVRANDSRFISESSRRLRKTKPSERRIDKSPTSTEVARLRARL